MVVVCIVDGVEIVVVGDGNVGETVVLVVIVGVCVIVDVNSVVIGVVLVVIVVVMVVGLDEVSVFDVGCMLYRYILLYSPEAAILFSSGLRAIILVLLTRFFDSVIIFPSLLRMYILLPPATM